MMQTIHRPIVAALGLMLLASAAWGQSLQSRVEGVVRSADLGAATIAVHVRDLADGLSVAEVNAERPMVPASNQKLITTAAALMLFDEDFAFRTQLRYDDGRLIVVGDGDPAFGDPRILGAMGMSVEDLLARWVAVVQKHGIERIDALLIDDRAFDAQQVHPNWPTDQLHLWYCAPVAGINFNDNCLDIYAAPSERGGSPVVMTRPIDAPVVLTNLAQRGRRNALWATRTASTNRITVRGTVRYRFKAPIYVTVHDPPMVLGKLLADRLADAGVKVGGVARVADGAEVDAAKLLAEVRTPLAEVVKRCNKDSQNLFAEALLKRIGRKATGDPGSWANGAAATRMFLSKLLGPDASTIVIDDGSGMSRRNKVTAELLTRLLARMTQADAHVADVFIGSLPEGGADGTLRRRFDRPATVGTVRGKSGYLRQTLALSGYVEHEHHTYAYSILLNDFDKPAFKGKRLIDQFVYAIDAYMAEREVEREKQADPALGG